MANYAMGVFSANSGKHSGVFSRAIIFEIIGIACITISILIIIAVRVIIIIVVVIIVIFIVIAILTITRPACDCCTQCIKTTRVWSSGGAEGVGLVTVAPTASESYAGVVFWRQERRRACDCCTRCIRTTRGCGVLAARKAPGL